MFKFLEAYFNFKPFKKGMQAMHTWTASGIDVTMVEEQVPNLHHGRSYDGQDWRHGCTRHVAS